MKKLLLLALLSVCVGAVGADVPDDANSTCEPWDTNGCVFVTPGCTANGNDAGNDAVTVLVRNEFGDPIEGSVVEIDFGDCPNLFICNPDGLTGTTNVAGMVVMNPQVGGCDMCTVIVRADGVSICTYTPPDGVDPTVRSTDWDGSAANGQVTGADFGFFAAAFKTTQDECANYNCDEGGVTGTDFAIFAESFKAPDSCVPCP